MPNWCHNYLTVEGDYFDLKDFEKDVDVYFIQGANADELELPNTLFDTEEECKKEIARIKEGIGDDDLDLFPKRQPLSFTRIVPEPTYEGYEKSGVNDTASEGRDTWYTWRLRNWGCKWDASFGTTPLFAMVAEGANVEESVKKNRMTESVEKLFYKFDTPWAPPFEVVEEASNKYPKLKFTLVYGEPGDGYGGISTFEKGELVSEEESSAKEVLEPEDMWF